MSESKGLCVGLVEGGVPCAHADACILMCTYRREGDVLHTAGYHHTHSRPPLTWVISLLIIFLDGFAFLQ